MQGHNHFRPPPEKEAQFSGCLDLVFRLCLGSQGAGLRRVAVKLDKPERRRQDGETEGDHSRERHPRRISRPARLQQEVYAGEEANSRETAEAHHQVQTGGKQQNGGNQPGVVALEGVLGDEHEHHGHRDAVAEFPRMFY